MEREQGEEVISSGGGGGGGGVGEAEGKKTSNEHYHLIIDSCTLKGRRELNLVEPMFY